MDVGVFLVRDEAADLADRDQPRTTHILERGEYDKPRDVVEPHTPDALPPMPEGTFRLRLLGGIALLCFALLWIRLFALQVVHHREYADTSDSNRIQLVVDIARRGLLRDRTGRILAQNDPSYSVYLMRSKAQPL